MPKSCAASLASLPTERREAFLDDLSDEAVLAMPWIWEVWRNELHQTEPDGDWATWVILGGRGAGKTRAGSEWVRSRVEGATPLMQGRCRRIALVGETLDQVRAVMVEGDSGILACTPPDRRPKLVLSQNRLVWPNGAEAMLASATNYEALRGPQFDAAWADETGCPAVDLGANQPNVFLDAKSSESTLPVGSRGARDDEMQRRFLQAKLGYWNDPARNPVSPVYGSSMIPGDRIFVWTWDARPWPDFPVRQSLWSDGPAHRRGHWITGRVTSGALADVVAEICLSSGLAPGDFDVSRLHGVVDGYVIDRTATGREALQPLLQAFGFDAFESAGRLVFSGRGTLPAAKLVEGGMIDRDGERLERRKDRAVAIADAVRLGYVQAENDYRAGAVESRLPGGGQIGVAETSMQLALPGSTAQAIADRWLSEAMRARESAGFGLPPSSLMLEPGDVISLGDSGTAETYRIDRINDSGHRTLECVRVEPGLYLPNPAADRSVEPELVRPPGPLEVVVLDLPLADGGVADHRPRLAVGGDPWTGDVAVMKSIDGESYALAATVEAPAMIGRSATALAPGDPGRWQRVTWDLIVPTGGLSSAGGSAVLSGANRLAVELPGGDWELLQFRDAELVGEDTYRMGLLLRGQRGTDALSQAEIPPGARIVLLDDALITLPIERHEIGLTRYWKIGPAQYDLSHPSFVPLEAAFQGVGLRPFAPAHLSARKAGGDIALDWVRTSRVGGEDFQAVEIPQAEMDERYRVTVRKDGLVLRVADVFGPGFVYTSAMQIEDGAAGTLEFGVARLSATVGYGPERVIKANA